MTKCVNPRRPYFLRVDELTKSVHISRPSCKMWKCEHCGRENTRRWGRKIGYAISALMTDGEVFYFMTLTSHEKLKTRAQTEKVFPLAWGKLYARMKRYHKGKMIYVSIPERHKNGRMHAHIITNVSMSKKNLKDMARACGFGYQADIKKIDGVGQVTGYVIKYMGKSIGSNSWSKRFRRVRTSRGLPAIEIEKEAGWTIEQAKTIVLRVVELLTQGYDLSGEYEEILERALKLLNS